MERDETNKGGMFATEEKRDGLRLQPFTLAIGQILEEKGNRFATGKTIKPKMGEVNELMFVMCTDIEDLLNIEEDAWKKEVLRFAAKLTPDQVETIQGHCENEVKRMNASQTTSAPGKPKGG